MPQWQATSKMTPKRNHTQIHEAAAKIYESSAAEMRGWQKKKTQTRSHTQKRWNWQDSVRGTHLTFGVGPNLFLHSLPSAIFLVGNGFFHSFFPVPWSPWYPLSGKYNKPFFYHVDRAKVSCLDVIVICISSLAVVQKLFNWNSGYMIFHWKRKKMSKVVWCSNESKFVSILVE